MTEYLQGTIRVNGEAQYPYTRAQAKRLAMAAMEKTPREAVFHEAPPAVASESEEECLFCLSGQEEHKPLRSTGCICSATNVKAHAACLLDWIEKRADDDRWLCGTCNVRYLSQSGGGGPSAPRPRPWAAWTIIPRLFAVRSFFTWDLGVASLLWIIYRAGLIMAVGVLVHLNLSRSAAYIRLEGRWLVPRTYFVWGFYLACLVDYARDYVPVTVGDAVAEGMAPIDAVLAFTDRIALPIIVIPWLAYFAWPIGYWMYLAIKYRQTLNAVLLSQLFYYLKHDTLTHSAHTGTVVRIVFPTAMVV